MRRRDFVTLLGGAAAAWPLAARAQRPVLPVIGFLCSATAEAYASRVAAFRQGLKEAGYTEGRNVLIEYRWAEGNYDRLPAMATDLVGRRVMGTDPVELGLVTSLNRPGSNLTGVSLLNVELGPKRLELLHEVVPTANMALLVNPSNRNAEVLSQTVHEAAHPLGVRVHVLRANSERDLDTVFGTLAELRVGALVIGSDPFFNARSKQLATLALRHRMPAIYQYREFAAGGGLMSYGGHVVEPFRQAGDYTGRILAGAKPADLPVVQSARVELIINVKTAQELGIIVPLSILGRADEVIE